MRLPAFLLVVTLAVLVPAFVLAQDAGTVASRRAALQGQLNALEVQIAGTQLNLDTLHGQRESLQRDIDILDAQIKKAKLQVQATEVAIQQLSANITTHASTIVALSAKLTQEKESLAQILRQTRLVDDFSVAEVALSAENVSAFFSDLDSFTSVKQALSVSFTEITDTRAQTEEEKAALEKRRGDQVELRKLHVLEQQKIQQQEAEKQKILAATKGKESAYQLLIESQQKTAGEIRAELFTLRDSAAIPFGQALQYAEEAEKATGVRAAVILGVLKQETNVGENLGSGTWLVDMHPTRDRPVFVYITRALGLDPDRMPVSRKPSYGWGGAMGPSQFIPSTWVCYGGFVNTHTGDCTNASRSFSWDEFWQGPWEYRTAKDRIRKLTGGGDISSPWNNEDAFMATALLMSDNGASAGTRAAERRAALRYFAGWTNASNPAYSFYGDGVMEFADEFQQQIDVLKRS